MKMKKVVLLFSMIAVLFALTGCSDGQEHVDFEYSSTEIVQDSILQSYQLQNVSEAYRAYLVDSKEDMAEVLLGGINNFDTVKEECGEYVGYRLKDGTGMKFDFSEIQSEDEETSAAAVEAFQLMVANVDYTIEASGNTVVVKVTALHESREVIYTYIYEKNPAYDYAQELYGQSVTSYQVKEITVAPDYTFNEKMSKAAMNTLMGMGTVFIVLIFIAFIIAQFEKINKLVESVGTWWKNRKEKRSEEVTLESETVATPVATTAVNPMDDSQLVAVITAAVVAASTANGGTDKLVVRSIRKAKR